MTEDNDLREIKKTVKEIDSRTYSISQNLPGLGLYTMVFLTWINSCDIQDRKHIRDSMKAELDARPPVVQKIEIPPQNIENVIGEKAPETYYEINGERAYTKIDGKPVTEYLQESRISPYTLEKIK